MSTGWHAHEGHADVYRDDDSCESPRLPRIVLDPADPALRGRAHEAAGCQFNEWNECEIHRTDFNSRGYDEPTCGAVDAVLAAITDQEPA